jgi:hypothetical protein
VTGLHRAAAAWHQEQGLVDEAVRHALAAGDDAWAARLVERYVDARLLGSEAATLARWLAALPAELVGSRLRLLLAQALLARLRLQHPSAPGREHHGGPPAHYVGPPRALPGSSAERQRRGAVRPVRQRHPQPRRGVASA